MNPLPNLTRRYWRFPKHMTSLEIEVHVDAPLAVPKFHFTRSSISNNASIFIARVDKHFVVFFYVPPILICTTKHLLRSFRS